PCAAGRQPNRRHDEAKACRRSVGQDVPRSKRRIERRRAVQRDMPRLAAFHAAPRWCRNDGLAVAGRFVFHLATLCNAG
ncbi:MAG TPA: hypothetical protein VII10_15915, partial [Reyranella sp.]